MNLKKFLLAGFVGGIVYFFLGWLFYGIVFKSLFPSNANDNMTFIFLGCMTFSFFISYIFTKWASISKPERGANAGAGMGLFFSLTTNFFMNANLQTPDYKTMVTDIAITTIMASIVGAIVVLTIRKIK